MTNPTADSGDVDDLYDVVYGYIDDAPGARYVPDNFPMSAHEWTACETRLLTGPVYATQPPSETDHARIAALAETVDLPPVQAIVKSDGRTFIWDGHHRTHAAFARHQAVLAHIWHEAATV